jgi:hypothetical protein
MVVGTENLEREIQAMAEQLGGIGQLTVIPVGAIPEPGAIAVADGSNQGRAQIRAKMLAMVIMTAPASLESHPDAVVTEAARRVKEACKRIMGRNQSKASAALEIDAIDLGRLLGPGEGS